jgi:hypothetical protein
MGTVHAMMSFNSCMTASADFLSSQKSGLDCRFSSSDSRLIREGRSKALPELGDPGCFRQKPVGYKAFHIKSLHGISPVYGEMPKTWQGIDRSGDA